MLLIVNDQSRGLGCVHFKEMGIKGYKQVFRQDLKQQTEGKNQT